MLYLLPGDWISMSALSVSVLSALGWIIFRAGSLVRAFDELRKSFEEKRSSIQDMKKSIEELRISVDDTKKSLGEVWIAIDDTNKFVAELRISVDDTRKSVNEKDKETRTDRIPAIERRIIVIGHDLTGLRRDLDSLP